MPQRLIRGSLAVLAGLFLAVEAPAAEPLFDQSRLHEVRLYIDPVSWQTLQAKYQDDDYYLANVSLDGTVLRQIGVRSRGTGSRNATKPALKLDFNQFVSSQEWAGYKELVLRNAVQDASFLRERLAYQVFEAMGIPAPRTSFARFYVNDEYWGLYSVSEPVGKPFLQSRFGEDGGNLFDYEWAFPYDFSFRGDEASRYVPIPFKPETNEKNLDASGLVDFARAVTGASDDTFVADMGAWLDRDRLLTYVAVENAIAEGDGLLGVEGMNNFYLYQYDGQRRFTFIPWDKDTSFTSPSWPIFARVERHELIRRLLNDPSMRTIYTGALLRAVTTFVNSAWLLPRLETAYTQIREAALLDTHKPYTNEQFELAVGGLRGVIAAREADVRAQITAPN